MLQHVDSVLPESSFVASQATAGSRPTVTFPPSRTSQAASADHMSERVGSDGTPSKARRFATQSFVVVSFLDEINYTSSYC